MPAYNPDIYRFTAKIIRSLIKIFFRMRIEYPEKVPPRGALIMCSNHASYLDPILLGAVSPRPVRFMMQKLYYDIPPIGLLSSLYGSFPVKTTGITKLTFKYSQEILRTGDILGIFPEGGRSRDGKLKPAKSGAILLAMRERVPVIPVGITGAFNAYPPSRIFPRPRPISVRFGEPITAHLDYVYPGDKKRIPELSDLLMEKIKQLVSEKD